MKTLKKLQPGTICKYCEITFGPNIKMWQSFNHGYYICQECFKDRQEKKLTI